MSGAPSSWRRSRGPRLTLAALTLITTILGAWVFFQGLAENGVGALDYILLALFVVLFVWVAMSFWTATIGFFRGLVGLGPSCAESAPRGPLREPLPPTAILMPVYNEEPAGVFAGLKAIYESLQATGHGQAFDFFILSDTTNPNLWLAEELAWAELRRTATGASGVYYRHRPQNVARKSGNIADFCERWGPSYRHMIVLDADSVMSGETLVELVRRMEEDPELGILQAPPAPVNRVSLFARCQQFAARVYGPVFLEGFAWWSQIDGNYWGHNAIIRIEPFIKHCGLSALPGAAPLGGEILSHDFVEAALMRRAGYKVCLAHDLEGSYEECPPTLVDYAQRDQRWCQGNMQHIRLVFSQGMRAVSRLHFGMGVMSYLASPLWLVFLLLSFFAASFSGQADANASHAAAVTASWWPFALFAITMVMLLLPKFYGFLLMLREPGRLKQCGGAAKVLASVVIETLVSILVAPIMMAFHSTFVVATFLGQRVHWNAQQRSEQGLPLWAAWSSHWRQTVAGVIAAVVVWLFTPEMLPWLSPVLVGLIFAAPLSMLLSSVALGKWFADWGLLLTPEETAAPPVLQRQRELLALVDAGKPPATNDLFQNVLLDGAFHRLHLSVLHATGAQAQADAKAVRSAAAWLRRRETRALSDAQRKAVLGDAEALRSLHQLAWALAR